MDTNTTPKKAPHPDAALIDSLGGPSAVAKLLGYQKRGCRQRVCNWKTRGIPEVIRLRRTDIFGPAPEVPPDAAA